ncbi:phosphomannomutase/phosphoglucomutase [Desulfovibrio inopinatus]|uniref:phosphomannomutase/phosphoglucomutase n=1 Tax=Desulfovibrio inopinatus TaxID=102109 RepID=UPI00040EF2DE|nr:phosphomannomutase/phosphoglucomutase [Desulfovibrio inopinatus]
MKTDLYSVFRAYDIRGKVDIDFDLDVVTRLGKAIGTYFCNHGVDRAVVGRDCRLSSPDYAACLVDGLRQCGVHVISLGLVPTPLLYFAVQYFGLKAGVMVTASHNPPQYNGFKIWFGHGTLHSDELSSIGDIMRKDRFTHGTGIVSTHDIRPAYLDVLQKNFGRFDRNGRPRVVLDGGNGAGGLVAAAALRQAGIDVTELYCQPDGRFPNHHPDPVVEANIGDLKKRVVSENAICGLGLDGDADRLGVVDENGAYVSCDRILAIYARELLATHPGSRIAADVKCSRLVFDDITRHGGEPLMTPSGHSFVKEHMRRTGAILGGELAGHFYFADRYFGFDDGIYAALRLVEILCAHPEKSLSGWLDDWPETWTTPEIRIPCPETKQHEIIEKARRFFQGHYDIVDIDGLRLEFFDGFALIRASNTQPEITMRFEAGTQERLHTIRKRVEEPLSEWLQSL